MTSAASSTSSQPLPVNLKSLLPNPRTPWNVSSLLFNRLKIQAPDQSYKTCEILNSDTEFSFILKYFEHQKPAGYGIKRIVCIHNPDHTGSFEFGIKNMEREYSNPVFTPKGKEEEPKAERARVITRWESQVAQFSPVEIKSANSREANTCSKTKVLPLWHGSSKAVCQFVCSSGFTSFGKHHYFDESASKGNTSSTDKGYFGSGIYFTNSAQYAALYSSEGYLLLSWVSMREPYPVVNDKPYPQKGSDMIKLGGKEHYQNYNAHYIPVASIRPQDPKCLEYYPCYKDQQPAWDEFVVFHTSQALPRFWVELGVDFPKVVMSNLINVGELLSLLLSLADKTGIKNNPSLVSVLQAKIERLLDLPETTPLEAEDDKFYKLAKRVMEGEKVNESVVRLLLKNESNPSPSVSLPADSSVKRPVQKPLPPPPVAKSKTLSTVSLPIIEDFLSGKSSHPQQIGHTVNPTIDINPSPASAELSMEGKSNRRQARIFTSQLAKAGAPTTNLPLTSLLPAIAFGKVLWEKYIGDVGVEPPLPPNIHEILQSPCPFFPDKRVEETHLLILIPKTVNGKVLTLNSLLEHMKHPKQGQMVKHQIDIQEPGGISIQNSYWVLLTNDVIPKSRPFKNYGEKVQLLKKYSQKANVSYEVPHLLETTTGLFLEYLRMGKWVYNNSISGTFTFCQEKLSQSSDLPLTIVGVYMNKLWISSSNKLNSGLFGMGASRRFLEETKPSSVASTSKEAEKTTMIVNSPQPTPLMNPTLSKPLAVPIAMTRKQTPTTRAEYIALALTPAKSNLPAIAFGKELWAQYIGDVGIEPPLPSNIQEILQSPCPFWPGKKVQETHLLTLIPKTVNGKPLTLNYLEELVKQPKQGQATKYMVYYPLIQNQYGETPVQNSYWTLLTKDVLPGSRNIDIRYDIQVNELKRFSQKANESYEVPRLLEAATILFMEYLRTGKIQAYSVIKDDSGGTFPTSMYCQERVPSINCATTVTNYFGINLIISVAISAQANNGLGGLRKFSNCE